MRPRLWAPLVCSALMALPAAAQVSDTTLLVAARALSFLQHPPQGEIIVGIVYQPGNAQSTLEATQLNAMMEDGFRAGQLVLRPRLITLDELAGSNVGLYFLTSELGHAAIALAQLNRSRKIPCITTDIVQVRDGNCAMGVRAIPRVEILVNRAAAAASGMTFSEAFRVMITEL
ncbi:MAG TPA: hypothetical protein VHN17_13240 [Steroidobacteraceae bacterium]|jgi:hypothetical protein|nr:hypothetical protein [Steroidobacteraceae bacterium]